MKLDILAAFILAMSSVIVVAWFARRATAGALAGGGAFMDEFFVAGRSLGPLVLAATFFTTIASAGTFIGYPGLAYQNGLTVVMTGINQITMFYLTFGLVGKRMAIVGKRTGAVTFTDLLRNRFDHPLVVIGSTAAILVFFVAFMVAQFAGAARILQAVAGVPYLYGIAVFAGVVATTVILGGFRAVAWTDAIQGVFMLLGLAIVLPVMIYAAGGLGAITEGLLEADPGLVFGPGPDGWLPPTMLLSFWFLWSWIAVGNPATAMRFFAARDSRSIHRGMIVGTVVATLVYVPMFFMGAGARVLFPDTAPDQAILDVYLTLLPNWLVGLVLAAPFAAVVSTVDSLLIVASGALIRDLYHRYINPQAAPNTVARLTYLATVGLMAVVVWLSLTPPDLIAEIVIYFGGGITAAFLVTVLAALYSRRARTFGAIASIFGGFTVFLVVETWFDNPLDLMSYVWGLAASGLFMIIGSRFGPPPPAEVIAQFFGSPQAAASMESISGGKGAKDADTA